MIEKVIYDYLDKTLSVPVKFEKPKEYKKLVLIDKTGGYSSNQIYHSTIAIQSYAPSLLEAMELNESVKESMNYIVSLDSVSKCALNSDYNFSNATTKEYRYQAVFDITHY